MGAILLFELRQRLRRISTYVYFLVLFGFGLFFVMISGGAFSSASVDFGTGGKVLLNSPFALIAIVGYTSFFGVIITAALAGQATYQDIDNNCGAFFYTAPITKMDYLGGRFLGALAVQLLIFPGLPLGAWVGMHLPVIDQARLGPDRFIAYVQPLLLLVIPNLLITTAIFFAVATFTRKMLPVYVSSVILLVGYLVASQVAGNVSANVWASLADPFGGNAYDRVTQYWTPFERNTRLVALSGILLVNRLLWLAVGAAIFAFTYVRFSRSTVINAGRPRRQVEGIPEAVPAATLSAPDVAADFSWASSFRQFRSLTRLQFQETVKNVFFLVILLAGFSFCLIGVFDLASPFAVPVYPVTYRMIEIGGGFFGLFALAIITFYSGELVWRERDAGVSQIVDAMPVQRWVLFGSKLSALMLIQVLLMAVVLAAGLTRQVSQGYFHFEFGLYFRELFINQLISYCVLCVLALWIHTIVNQKYLGHFVMVLYYMAMFFVIPTSAWQNYLYRFGRTPAYTYSAMNGYGPFAAPLIWFHIYWILAAIMLAVITNVLWVRGTGAGLRERLGQGATRLSAPSKLVFTAAAILFIAIGGYIFYNTKVLNIYRTGYQIEEERTQYERKYRAYLSLPPIKVTDVKLQVDLDPERRVLNIKGTEWLENKSNSGSDQVAITLWPQSLQPLPRPKIEIRKLQLAGGMSPVIEDTTLGFYLYKLPAPLPPHGRVALDFDLTYALHGFPNANENTDIVNNGTFVTNAYAPEPGYDDGIELRDDSVRHKHGLTRLRRIPKLEDAAGQQNLQGLSAADWVNAETIISTAPDQIAMAPGYLQKEWMENGRRYFDYKTEAPILYGISLTSGRYQVLRDRWNDVNLEIYYHPGHEFNLDRMRLSMKDTLDYCSKSFSPFQFRQLRIIEFPRYQTFAQSFANTIPFSENIGFIARVDARDSSAIDLPYYVTAHEIAHQWWGHQVSSGNNEGATMVVESMAQYSALMVMKHRYGPEAMRKFLRYELNRYLLGRGQERNEEKPLLRVEENQGYIHYNKGSVIMYALQDYIGEDKVNQALSAFLNEYRFHGPPYPRSLELMNHLKAVTPPEYQYLYEDFFENITLYENRAKSATATRTADGKYQVKLAVELKKFRADGRGEEHQLPNHDWVDIGVTDRAGHYLYLQRQKMDAETREFTVTVDKPPYQAGIDPLNKLIDRKPDDNLIKVNVQ
jgi:hypothetical protein